MNATAMGMTDEELAELVARWPGVARAIKWEVDVVYSVARHAFAVQCMLGIERGRLSFKVEPERFLELSEQPGMMQSPHAGRAFWISVTEPERYTNAELSGHVRRSYELVVESLSAKAQDALSADSD
ncbi:MAG: MmcQ/YjbR family DNA-binding protein [Rhodanobacteraceae bacterium]